VADRIAPTRLARAATAALWPVALAVPLLPLVLGTLLGATGPAGGAFIGQLAAMQGIVLLGTLAGARLVGIRMQRARVRLVTRYESWAVLALAFGGTFATLGVVVVTTGGIAPAGIWLIDGMWMVVVAAGALIVLPLRVLRRVER
jgi:hypothetical protein